MNAELIVVCGTQTGASFALGMAEFTIGRTTGVSLRLAESGVAAEHCVVRWLQLDEGASNFAHFVIAVLRPALNE